MSKNKKFYDDRCIETATRDFKGGENGRKEYLLNTQGVIPGGSGGFITI